MHLFSLTTEAKGVIWREQNTVLAGFCLVWTQKNHLVTRLQYKVCDILHNYKC